MRKFHPFFTIGTVGMIVTAVLHMSLTLGLSFSSTNKTFIIMYPTFLAFLVIGMGLTIKKQKELIAD
jgi:hypothetical protein